MASIIPRISSPKISSANLCRRVSALPLGSVRLARRLPVCNSQPEDSNEARHVDLAQGDLFSGVSSVAVLASAAAARAEDVTDAAAAAGAATSAGGFGAGEAVLLLTPALVYALFNVYRDKFNPQAKFLDYMYIMVALAIFGNIFSILIFNTRFF